MIESLLKEKYGKEIISNLIIKGQMNLDNIASKGKMTEIVNNQMKKMIELDLLSESDFEEGKQQHMMKDFAAIMILLLFTYFHCNGQDVKSFNNGTIKLYYEEFGKGPALYIF